MTSMWLHEVFPLYCLASIPKGGLSISLATIGSILFFGSVALVVFQFACFHRIVKELKPKGFFVRALLLLFPLCVVFPLGSTFLGNDSEEIIWCIYLLFFCTASFYFLLIDTHLPMVRYVGIVQAVTSILVVNAFSSVFMLINNSSRHTERGAGILPSLTIIIQKLYLWYML